MNATVAPERGSAPWHLWAVGIVSLCWNGYGAYDYTMSHVGGLAFYESVGLDAEAFTWVQAMPGWAVAAWAIGVWVSVAGSILLLLRSRHAATAFAVSLIGALVSFAYQFTSDKPASLEGGMASVIPVVILIAIAAQWYYAKRMIAAGVLR